MKLRLFRRRGPGEEELAARVRALPREIAPPADLWASVAPRLRDALPAPDAAPARPSGAWGLRRAAWRAPFATPRPRWGIRPAVTAALALCLAGVLWLRLAGRAGWRIAQASGAYTFAGGRLATAPAGRVRLDVGRIGTVDVLPGSRLRLLSARPDHRLALDRGTIAARITAPPRLFFVETPSATAVDLGCAYTLAVDPRGGSQIHVTVGWVELRSGGATSVVPFDMSAYTRPGSWPGTPFADRASDALKAALYRFDFGRGGDSAVATVLRAATADDAVTLWHLLARTSGATRLAVYRRLAALAPPPSEATETRVLALDRRAMRAWWDALPGSPGTLPWWQRLAVRVAAWLGLF
jgi:hypothetical protein